MSRKHERCETRNKPGFSGGSSVDQVRRVFSPFADNSVRFEINEVNLIDLVQGKQGIIFRSQPGGGKSHTIDRFRQDFEKRYGDNVLLRSIKWSDRLRDKDILGNRKPRPDSLTPEKRQLAAKRFLSDALVSFTDVVKKQRRGRRVHPRGLFTIAEVPDGVIDDANIKQLVQQGFLLIDLIPDPAFQRQAIKERQMAWDSETGQVIDTATLRRRHSAPPEVMAMSIKRSRQAQKQVFFEGEEEWRWLSQIPVPDRKRRHHDDSYHMARSALASMIRSEMLFAPGTALVAYNRRAA